jgi:MacB-like periplasmic core domain/FtsX-like permease family
MIAQKRITEGNMENLIQDLRYAIRTLSKSPTFLVVAALTLALGIGANVAIFTLVNTVLLQPLPFQEPDRLVRVFDDLNGASATDVGISVPELLDLSDRAGVFAQLCAMAPASTALSGGDRVERIEMLGTSPNYFEVLGAKAAVGRVYGQADWVPGFVDGVVISDALWKRQFGGDPHVIGRRIRVDEDGYTIIGVMAPEFRHPGPTLARDVELWAAAGLIAPPFPTPPIRSLRVLRSAMGRLKPGLTLAQAQQKLNAFVAQLTQQNDHAAEFGAVSPLWFATLKIPLQKGRVFTDVDSELANKVVVVNEAFARAFSRQKDVIGRRLRDSAGREFEIVGVVGDVRDQRLDLPARPRIYASIFQVSNMSLAVFLRTHSDVTAIRDMVTQSVRRVDVELPVFGVRAMEDIMSTSMARRRFSVVLMSIFAALALFLAALGIYGVMAFVVGQRSQEFGIRRALGAQPRDILFLALRPGLILTCTGIIVGLAASIAVTHLMSSLLFGVSASDALTFATVPAVLAIVAVTACLIPATRATRVSPVQALRF